MDRLLSRTYSVGWVALINGVATDAYIAHDWDCIKAAYYRGQLTDEALQWLADDQGDTGVS